MAIIEFWSRGGGKTSRSEGLQASLSLEMLRSWDFLNHGEESIKPILCHPELVSGSSHRKTLEITQNKVIATSTMGQMLNQVQHDKKKKVAFTLAEVLITLGIIGVVAALTLPTLISNYQKQVYVNQLKKSVSVLSQGFTTMMGHDGVTELKDTEAFSGITTSYCESDNILTDDCRSIREGLESVFSGVQFTPCDPATIKYLNGEELQSFLWRKASKTCIVFPDGSEIYSYSFLKQSEDYVFGIDINGPKNPNTYGRDIFQLYLTNNGMVNGIGSQNDPTGINNYWRTTGSDVYRCDNGSDSRGSGCAGRVLEEDAMNY